MAEDNHHNIYSRALTEAKEELSEINRQIEHLNKRSGQVGALIENLASLLPEQASPTLKFPTVEASAFAALPPQPIWKSILHGINGKCDAFTIKDAIEALESVGRPVESPNRFQIVRNVLKKKTENFEQIDQSTYRVKNTGKGVISEEITP